MDKKIKKTTKKKPSKKGKPIALPSKNRKWSVADKNVVVQKIIVLILKEKKTQHYLLTMLQSEPYSFSKRHSYTLVKRARDVIHEQYKDWNVSAIEEMLADLQWQKEQAQANNNLKLVLSITQEENKIKGLYVERQEIKQEINMKFDFDLGEDDDD